MFKKGQVIRGVLSGWVYLVLRTECERSIEVVVLRTPDKRRVGKKTLIRSAREYQLLGNNYQERPTTKALPEQRGCRKEDC